MGERFSKKIKIVVASKLLHKALFETPEMHEGQKLVLWQRSLSTSKQALGFHKRQTTSALTKRKSLGTTRSI